MSDALSRYVTTTYLCLCVKVVNILSRHDFSTDAAFVQTNKGIWKISV